MWELNWFFSCRKIRCSVMVWVFWWFFLFFCGVVFGLFGVFVLLVVVGFFCPFFFLFPPPWAKAKRKTLHIWNPEFVKFLQCLSKVHWSSKNSFWNSWKMVKKKFRFANCSCNHTYISTYAWTFLLEKSCTQGKKSVPRCAQKSQSHYWKVDRWRGWLKQPSVYSCAGKHKRTQLLSQIWIFEYDGKVRVTSSLRWVCW